MSIMTNEEFGEALDATFEDVADWGDYEAPDFESNVDTVANILHNHTQDQPGAYHFTFGWERGRDAAYADAGMVSVFTKDSVYVSKWIDSKDLTADRRATGAEQADAIRYALTEAYNEVVAVATKYGMEAFG